jgi:DNA-binding LacI/PurR family transcriptional regulator
MPRASRSQKKWVIECDHTLKGGVAGFASCRRSPRRPTAILCSNDMTAIGVLRAAYMEGLRVPQDLSVIGLDDIDFAEFTLPPLTTIRLSRIDLARAAFEALRQQAEDPAIPPNAARIPGLHQPGGARIDRPASSS